MKLKNFVIKLFLLVIFPINAQMLNGLVIDKNKHPLKEVELTINNKLICKTDTNGSYSFQYISIQDTIQFTKKGYVQKKYLLNDLLKDQKRTIILEPIIELKPIIISGKKYKKQEISIGLGKKTNSRIIATPEYEIAAFIKNSSHFKGKINTVNLFLHKTKKDVPLTNLEINFYTVDSITGQPLYKILYSPIIFKSKKRSRGKYKIDVEEFNIPFPKNGVFVSIKWQKLENNKLSSVGPSLRLTRSSNKYYTYYKYKSNNWNKYRRLGGKNIDIVNAMIGLNVWVRKN